MISDVLHDAASDIREYLESDKDWYSAATWPSRPRLDRLLAEMDALREELDTAGFRAKRDVAIGKMIAWPSEDAAEQEDPTDIDLIVLSEFASVGQLEDAAQKWRAVLPHCRTKAQRAEVRERLEEYEPFLAAALHLAGDDRSARITDLVAKWKQSRQTEGEGREFDANVLEPERI